MPQLEDSQAEGSEVPLIQPFVLLVPSTDRMRPTHVGGKQYAQCSLSIQMAISSRNILTDTPRTMQCMGPVKLIQKFNHHRMGKWGIEG